jgi:homogentisate 1,2-dioxygenase
MFYAAHGSIPPKRHTQHRAPDGSLYAEELFGVEGFTGRSSLLYHVTPPTQTYRIEPASTITIEEADDGSHHHRLIDAAGVEPHGDAVTGRIPLFFNSDIVMGVVRPADQMPETVFYRNGEADELLYIHEGEGVLDTNFGPIRYGPGDYLVLPIGTTWRLDPDAGSEQRILYLEAPSEIEPPKRYRNDYGQLLEHSPYSQRDIHAPDLPEPNHDEGEFIIDVRSTDRITAYHYRHHPFDVVGWDGYLWPFRFDIADFQPITGRVHQPPPVHQTFQARNFVVCSFVPRKFDYHPLAIPAPYNHSNINSDEVIYYVAGNFMSRRGVDIASFTLHPAGIAHGPHPGTAEASIGKEATEELAVMVDTFHPLFVTKAAMDLDDPKYPYSWLPPEEGSADHAREASELAERGPEAFPD